MNILWSIHLYYPRHGAGAESMARNINRELVKRGHTVKVLLNDANKHKINTMYDHEGVTVFPPDPMIIDNLFRWADVVISHLDYNKWTSFQCAKYGKKMIHVVHNDTPYPSVIDCPCDLKVIYNSEWCKKKLNYKWPSIVFPPPVDENIIIPERKKKFIAMVNLNENKGARFFYSVAKKLPQYNFLAIKGSYESQILSDLPNVTTVPNVSDIRVYLRDVAIMMQPSHYESWGMVSTEAMFNGIPVICHPTDGLKENVANGGIFIDRKDTGKMAAEVDKLMSDEKYYDKWSKAAKKRAKELVPKWDELINFVIA